MKHLFMQLNETLSLLGQADALCRVKALPGVFNVEVHGPGYKVDLVQPSHALTVTKNTREINCIAYVGPCRRLPL
jgi:hypothetical protein